MLAALPNSARSCWFTVLLAIVATMAIVPVAHAESRSPAQATAHALDELANCRAQQRPDCPTDVPTSTPRPTPIATPTLQPATPGPTDTPEPTPTPGPCWLTDPAFGDPADGYVVFDADGAPIPCPTDVPAPVEPLLTDTATPTPTLVPVPTAAPVAPAPPQIVYVQLPAPPAPAPEVRYEVREVTSTPTPKPADPPPPSDALTHPALQTAPVAAAAYVPYWLVTPTVIAPTPAPIDDAQLADDAADQTAASIESMASTFDAVRWLLRALALLGTIAFVIIGVIALAILARDDPEPEEASA